MKITCFIRSPCRDPVFQATMIYGPSANSNLITPVQTKLLSLSNARAFFTIYCKSLGHAVLQLGE